jgi:hypothetical protein
MWLRAGSETRHGDTFRARGDPRAERLPSTLWRHTGSMLAGGHCPSCRLLRPNPKRRRHYAAACGRAPLLLYQDCEATLSPRRCMAILSPDLLGCVLATACSRMACEAIEVRRGVYLLLTVFLVQFSGLRGLCVPSHHQTHACCPTSAKTTLPSSPSLPDCCVNSILNYQGSIIETRSSDRPSEFTAQSAAVSVRSVAPLVAISAPAPRLVLPPLSPPRSPLSQSCLLLI